VDGGESEMTEEEYKESQYPPVCCARSWAVDTFGPVWIALSTIGAQSVCGCCQLWHECDL
jgi:hypothetical protein